LSELLQVCNLHYRVDSSLQPAHSYCKFVTCNSNFSVVNISDLRSLEENILNQLITVMKTTILLILSLFTCMCSAQEFGKTGTVWKHCYVPILEGNPPKTDYIEVRSMRDTIINNLQCHELMITHRPEGFSTKQSILVCNDKEKAYYLEGDSLHLIYDFSLGAGDSYVVRYPVEFDTSFLFYSWNKEIHSTIHIDSVSYKDFNGQMLKVQHIHVIVDNGGSSVLFGNYITEHIGYENWVLPNYHCGPCDAHVFAGLHSFEDAEISFHDFNSHCRVAGTTSLKNKNDNIILYPVPATDYIFIQLPEDKESLAYHIYDLTGNSFPFNIEKSFETALLRFELNPGMYILESRFATGDVLHCKFLVQKK
jgi:hypothetical protein